ncbi:MAG: VOC family protein, partial [Bacillota bacterium]|nr:VOC family protein [Bacillota bacterium]
KFYTEALGLEITREKDFPDHEFTLVFLSDKDRNFELELTYNYKPDHPYVIGDGFSHLAVSVDDLEGSRQKHLDLGYECTELMGLPGTEPSYYFVTDPDGYEVEVIRKKK